MRFQIFRSKKVIKLKNRFKGILPHYHAQLNIQKTFLFIVIAILSFANVSFSQNDPAGKMVKENGHYIAALDFFGTYRSDTKGSIQRQANDWKGDGSFLLKGYEDYENNGIKVSGLVQSAILMVDWWTLFNEPAENYNFQWLSSGKYSVEFKNQGDANYQKKWVERNDLSAYPDLLKRFDALQPLDMHFEISWGLDNLEARYKSIGEAYRNIKTQNFTIQIKNGMLFEPSGKRPLSVTGIRQGKGHNFLGLPSNYDPDEVSEIFKCMTGESRADIKIWNFKVIYARWPVEEMKAIAQLYDDYKSGKKEPTPLEQVAEADKENADLRAYTKNDFWSEVFEEASPKITNIKHTTGSSNSFKIGNVEIYNVFYINNNYSPRGNIFPKANLENKLIDHLYAESSDGEKYPGWGAISKKYKKVIVSIRNEDLTEFRIYDFKGNIVFKDNNNRKGIPEYIVLADTPFVLINWVWGSSIGSQYLVNLETLQKIEFQQLKHSELDRIFKIYLVDKERYKIGSFLNNKIESEVKEYKLILIVEASINSSRGYQLYGISHTDEIVKLKFILN